MISASVGIPIRDVANGSVTLFSAMLADVDPRRFFESTDVTPLIVNN